MTCSSHTLRPAAALAVVTAVLVLFASLVGQPRDSAAQEREAVLFSRPLPSGATEESPNLSCSLAQFAVGPHSWKLRLRAEGTHTVPLILAASLVGAGKQGAVVAAIQDEAGLKSLSASYEGGNRSETLPLLLSGGKIYDVSVELRKPDPPNAASHHYRLGSSDPRLEIGWAGLLPFLEHQTAWVLHTEKNEDVRVEVLTDSKGIAEPANPTLATEVTASINRPDGTMLLVPTVYRELPVELSIPDSPGETLVVSLEANGHLLLRKTSGSDRGLYAIHCPWERRSPLLSREPGAPGAIPGDGGIPNRDSPPAQESGVAEGLLPEIIVGVSAAAGLLLAVSAVVVFRRKRAVLSVAAGVTTPSTLASQLSDGTDTPEAEKPAGGAVDVLTPREREVVALLARSLTNRQIADDLVISEATVKRHVENILQKLALRSRSEVAVWAVRQYLSAGLDDPLP